MKETDLYFPIKEIFTKKGFEVYGEVKDIDIVALKDDQITIVELKTSYTLQLILQAIERQKLTRSVYIAIPKPTFKKSFGRDFAKKKLLLRRLGIGLIFVNFKKTPTETAIILEPQEYDLKRSLSANKRKQKALLEEIKSRHGDNNIGGTNGKIITAYRESALLIASILEEKGPMSAKELKLLGTSPNTYDILYRNHYGWFEKVIKGSYALSEKGINELDLYRKIVAKLT